MPKKSIRTDHSTWSDIIRDLVRKITKGGLETDDRTKEEVGKAEKSSLRSRKKKKSIRGK